MKDISQDDDAQLASMGHRPELKRRFSTWYDWPAINHARL